MGLIRAAMGAAGGVMADQWKEYFYCEAMPADLLATRGWKRQSGRSANTKGNDNIISNGSIVAYGAGLKTVDFVVEGIDRSKEVMIVTDKAEEISAALMEAFECGTTKIAARGGYSDADKTIIYFVVNRFQISRMRAIIRSIDPKAFVTISDVADMFKSND